MVGGGVSTFFLDEATTGFVADLYDFFYALRDAIPAGTTITIPNGGDLIDVATGGLSGTWTDGTTQTVSGNGVGTWANGVGARILWPTSGVKNGRRVKGSTFIVPLPVAAYEGSSNITSAYLAHLESAATGLVAALGSNQQIYSRPVGGAGGAANTVVNWEVPDAVSWLRSRRT